MLVMDELSDVWTESKSDFDHALDFPEWWERDAEALVRKDRNHPSVIMYSIGNEIPEVGRPHGALPERPRIEDGIILSDEYDRAGKLVLGDGVRHQLTNQRETTRLSRMIGDVRRSLGVLRHPPRR